MNREQKAAAIEEVASAIQESEAIFAVDYRGISVPQAAELRTKLTEAGARFRVVKNTLTLLAVDKAGAEQLKEVLEGPTAFTFVSADGGDVALAAKALAQFRREHEILDFKGGIMGGEVLTIEQLQALSRLPGRDVLHGQLVGVVASPITGLVRGLNQLIAGFASQLQQLVDQGLVGGDEPAPAEETPAAEETPTAEDTPAEEAAPGEEQAPEEEAPAQEEEPPAEEPAPDEPAAESEQEAQVDKAEDEAEESAGEGEGGEPSTEGEAESETEEPETDAPDEGGDEEKEN